MSDRKPVIITEEQIEEQRQYIQQIRLMPDAPKSYHVVTYGCQMNAHDSEILAGMLRDMGMEEARGRRCGGNAFGYRVGSKILCP